MRYTEKNYKEARMVSIQAHGNQTYDSIYPYHKHLDDVVDVLKRFGFSGKYIVAGYLHDIIEDTALSYNKVKKYFGLEVAEMVYCVTDELGRDREEKKKKTLPKTASNPNAIVLKLADRIANLEHGGKVDMYAKEYSEFKGALYLNTPKDAFPMWEHLDTLLKKDLVESN
jgi:guanosine-3',5'-bis(diphosphate) 3'-pyrophosphohydrolase